MTSQRAESQLMRIRVTRRAQDSFEEKEAMSGKCKTEIKVSLTRQQKCRCSCRALAQALGGVSALG